MDPRFCHDLCPLCRCAFLPLLLATWRLLDQGECTTYPPPFQALRGAGLAILPTRDKVSCVRLPQGPEAHLSFCIWKDRERVFRESKDPPSMEPFATQLSKIRGEKTPICVPQRQQEILPMVIWLTCFGTAVTHSPCPVYF